MPLSSAVILMPLVATCKKCLFPFSMVIVILFDLLVSRGVFNMGDLDSFVIFYCSFLFSPLVMMIYMVCLVDREVG